MRLINDTLHKEGSMRLISRLYGIPYVCLDATMNLMQPCAVCEQKVSKSQ